MDLIRSSGQRQQVVRQNRQVTQLADLDGSGAHFVETEFRRVPGHQPQRLHPRDALGRADHAAAFGPAAHGGGHREERVERVHRVVRVEPEHVIGVDGRHHSGVEPRSEADERLEPAIAQRRSQRVGVLVIPRWLGIDQNAEPGRPRRGLRVDEVRVDERVTGVGGRVTRLRRLEGVEHRIDAGIAGDVRGHLPTAGGARFDGRRDLLARDRQEAAVRRVVHAVECARGQPEWLSHERGPREDPAVGDDLERSCLEPLITLSRRERQVANERLDTGRILRVGYADGHRRAHVQAAGVAQGLVDLESPQARPRVRRRW